MTSHLKRVYWFHWDRICPRVGEPYTVPSTPLSFRALRRLKGNERKGARWIAMRRGLRDGPRSTEFQTMRTDFERRENGTWSALWEKAGRDARFRLYLLEILEQHPPRRIVSVEVIENATDRARPERPARAVGGFR